MELKKVSETRGRSKLYVIRIPVEIEQEPHVLVGSAMRHRDNWKMCIPAHRIMMRCFECNVSFGLSEAAGEPFVYLFGAINPQTPDLFLHGNIACTVLKDLAQYIAQRLPADIGNEKQPYPRMIHIQYDGYDEFFLQDMKISVSA